MTLPTALLTPLEVWTLMQRGPQPAKLSILPPPLGRRPQAYVGHVIQWATGHKLIMAVRFESVEAALKYDRWCKRPGVVVLERSPKRRDNNWYPQGERMHPWYVQLGTCEEPFSRWAQIVVESA